MYAASSSLISPGRHTAPQQSGQRNILQLLSQVVQSEPQNPQRSPSGLKSKFKLSGTSVLMCQSTGFINSTVRGHLNVSGVWKTDSGLICVAFSSWISYIMILSSKQPNPKCVQQCSTNLTSSPRRGIHILRSSEWANNVRVLSTSSQSYGLYANRLMSLWVVSNVGNIMRIIFLCTSGIKGLSIKRTWDRVAILTWKKYFAPQIANFQSYWRYDRVPIAVTSPVSRYPLNVPPKFSK